MVQQLAVGNPLQGAFYPPRDSNWQRDDRTSSFPEEHRPHSVSVHFPEEHQHHDATTVEMALNHCAKISAKHFALIVLKEDGEVDTYSQKSISPYLDRIFNRETKNEFRRAVKTSEKRAPPSTGLGYAASGMYNEFPVDFTSGRNYASASSSERRPYRKSSADSDGDGSRSAKRTRRGGNAARLRETSNDKSSGSVSVVHKQLLRIGDAAEVERYYTIRFKDMQQSACKVMGKAFVKLIEPKKQTHHPYTKGDDKCPPWWPNTKGEDHVRHREPDHLLKRERVRLLVHILRLIVQPRSKQCATLQRLGGISVRTLEAATMEAMSTWFSEKDHPENESKRVFLKEIFKVARKEESYLNGEIDGSTGVSIQCGERMCDDDSDGEDRGEPKDGDDDYMGASSPVIMTPTESFVSPSMSQSRFQPVDEASLQRMRSTLPMRQFEPMAYEDPTSRSMSFPQTYGPNTMDPNRRSFVPTAFPDLQPGYQWVGGMSTAPHSSGHFTTSPQPAPVYLPPPQQQPAPPMIPTAFSFGAHGLPAPARYDPEPALGNGLRSGSLGHPYSHVTPPHPGSFQLYPDADHGGYSQHHEMKDEHHHQN
ncbi:hypothetical protein JHW43_001688 [Diplocarpon mali]|nr:hypothetical protein JHW43_001688 [Diplocarpon mali]